MPMLKPLKSKILWFLFISMSFMINVMCNKLVANKFGSDGIVVLGLTTNLVALTYLWGSLSSESGLTRNLVFNDADQPEINILYLTVSPLIGILGLYYTLNYQGISINNPVFLYTAVLAMPLLSYAKAFFTARKLQPLKALIDLLIVCVFPASILFVDQSKDIPAIAVKIYIITITIVLLIFTFYQANKFSFFYGNIKKQIANLFDLYQYSFHSLVSGFLALNLIILVRSTVLAMAGAEVTATIEAHYRTILWISTITAIVFGYYVFPMIIEYAKKRTFISTFKVIQFCGIFFLIYCIFAWILSYILFHITFSNVVQFSSKLLLIVCIYEALKAIGQFLSAFLLGRGSPLLAMTGEVVLYVPPIALLIGYNEITSNVLLMGIILPSIVYVLYLIALFHLNKDKA